MFKRAIALSLFLSTLFAGYAGALAARPYDASVVRAFLDAPDGCVSPCWWGIRPGETTPAEAAALLSASPWVGLVDTADDDHGRWYWNSLQPAFLREAGILYDTAVKDILIDTEIQVGDLWLTYGSALLHSVGQGEVRDGDYAPWRQVWLHNFVYPRQFDFRAEVRCPLNRANFWHAPVRIGYNSREMPSAMNTPFYLLEQAPC